MIKENKIELILGSNIYKISNKEDLSRFIGELIKDLKNNTETWENLSLENYLEAMQSWLEDMEGWEENFNIDTSKINTWELIGTILLASKMYE